MSGASFLHALVAYPCNASSEDFSFVTISKKLCKAKGRDAGFSFPNSSGLFGFMLNKV